MVNNLEKITDIITEEFECEYYSFRTHNPSHTIIKVGELEVFVKNDISVDDFRTKVAESFLTRISNLLYSERVRLKIQEKNVMSLNSAYTHYEKIVAKIADGSIKSLEPISWKSHSQVI